MSPTRGRQPAIRPTWRGPRARLAAALALAALALLSLAPAAKAGSGGLSSYSREGARHPREAAEPVSTPEIDVSGVSAPSGASTPAATAPGALARLVGERAVAPRSAPKAVRRVIAAANRIRSTPYIWGGGHGRWWDRGYDCSGAVSYVLHGGGLLDSPLVSGSFARWGERGPGKWITIYANRTHVYMTVAGLRWDTGGDPKGVSGPRWHVEPFFAKGFAVRHPVGY